MWVSVSFAILLIGINVSSGILLLFALTADTTNSSNSRKVHGVAAAQNLGWRYHYLYHWENGTNCLPALPASASSDARQRSA